MKGEFYEVRGTRFTATNRVIVKTCTNIPPFRSLWKGATRRRDARAAFAASASKKRSVRA